MTEDEGFCTGKDIPKPEIRKVTSIRKQLAGTSRGEEARSSHLLGERN